MRHRGMRPCGAAGASGFAGVALDLDFLDRGAAEDDLALGGVAGFLLDVAAEDLPGLARLAGEGGPEVAGEKTEGADEAGALVGVVRHGGW